MAAGFILVTLAATIPLAAGSYYFVERPALDLKDRQLRDWLLAKRAAASPATAVFNLAGPQDPRGTRSLTRRCC